VTLNFKKYNQRLFLTLGVALALLGGFNGIVDPYQRNGLVDLGIDKGSVSPLLSFQMFKIVAYAKAPQATIVLGDSRSLALKAEYFTEYGATGVYNFAYGGCTLFEAIDTFWYAVEQGRLERIIIGLPFSMFNETNSMNRFPAAREVVKNPMSYYLSPLVTKASFLNVASSITGKTLVSDVPEMSRSEFWQYQLGPGIARNYSTWQTPQLLWNKLSAMVEYCDKNNIDFISYIPPSHSDHQMLVGEYGLDAEYAAYKLQLAELGPVFDYDVTSPLTADRTNFDDPRHCTAEVANIIVKEIVSSFNQAPPAE